MEEELDKLKSVLRSLVVSSPVQVDVRALLRDYKEMIGTPLPIHKFGHRDPIAFLKERCSDSFLLQGTTNNPILTLIVPESIKHIDRLVQKQKSQKTNKGKRRSVMKSTFTSLNSESNLIVETFANKYVGSKTLTLRIGDCNQNVNNTKEGDCNQNINNTKENPRQSMHNEVVGITQKHREQQDVEHKRPAHNIRYTGGHDSGYIQNDSVSSYSEHDSARETLSSSSSSKRMQLEKLLDEVSAIVLQNPDGLWATDILKCYRQRYGCELNLIRFGYTSIVSLLQQVPGVTSAQVRGGDWRVWAGDVPPRLPPASPVTVPRPRTPTPDPDDALPGVQFDPDVFPSDCLHYTESIPAAEQDGLRPGDMLDVLIGEVYSPSHFWLLRLGEQNRAMEDIMDEMNQYYDGDGEGARKLATGAVRRGHYCSSRYEGDWHRSLIVKVIDSDTVKVRHVDYGTVERVQAQALRPLRREWGELPVQAVRARLSRVQPPNGARRWPHSATTAFLSIVAQKPLVAAVAAIDSENILEVVLVNTLTDEDVYVSDELVRAGHADPRSTVPIFSEPYLSPSFDALENGDTLNFAEISAYLRNGVVLDFLDEYRRYVPSALPSPPPSSPPVQPTQTLTAALESMNMTETVPQEQHVPAGEIELWNRSGEHWREETQGNWPVPETDWRNTLDAQLQASSQLHKDFVSIPVRVCQTFKQLCGINPRMALHYISNAIDLASAPANVDPPPGFGPHRFCPSTPGL
ncbi:tudor domain-containing protein 5 isoform X2 [Pieris rapae]|uniref:tudor domain-containing protein 5 isoform X2 n=1 Tax=Pieris rapae TaxID=64459 RepID=UPI001E27F9C9|nr:tudor domain-containing protein 5 isoform X2 [Pieris rapae]